MRLSNLTASILICLGLSAPAALATTVNDLLAGADVAKGEKVFKKCKACHTVKEGGKKKSGPNLFDVVGGVVAAKDGFKYSKALKEYGGDWTIERLDAFLTKPKAEVKRTKMSFAGLKKPEDRANLIAFLNQYSTSPMSFATAGEEAADAGQDAAVEEAEFGILFVDKGVEETYYACSACHSEMIVAQQGLTRDGWIEMFEWMVDEQGMNEIEEPDLTLILDYLAKNYGEDRPNFPRRN